MFIKKILSIIIFSLCVFGLHCQSIQNKINLSNNFLIAGNKNGLFCIQNNNNTKLYNNGIKKIIKVSYGYFLLTEDNGVVFTNDFINFEQRNNGIHIINLKTKNQDKWGYKNINTNLLDIKANENDDSNLITVDKTGVYYSLNQGKNWIHISSPSFVTGLKSICIINEKDTKRIYVSHPYKGIFTRLLTEKNWTNISEGLFRQNNQYEEIGDIISKKISDTSSDLYCSTNFSPKIFKFDGEKWNEIYQIGEKNEIGYTFDTIQDMSLQNDNISFSTKQGRILLNENKQLEKISLDAEFKVLQTQNISNVNCLYSKSKNYIYNFICHNTVNNQPYANAKGIYIPSETISDEKALDDTLTFMQNANLNAIVFDIKDDDGNLRYETTNEQLKKIANTNNPIDIQMFTRKAKEKNIYLIGRLVLFKDKNLYNYNSQKYAVKDKTKIDDATSDTKTGWQGYYFTDNPEKKADNDEPEYIKKYYKEFWVDPYCTDVWQYNIDIAKDIINYGIDEIQFDYIRFPTDGENLSDAIFTFKNKTNDTKESAILSFLNYAHSEITVPISIDVYGGNGYHRTGGSTGQDVQTLAKYVDIICPMFYPSHFEEIFFDAEPIELRTYRIYYYGSLRNQEFVAGNAIIRPYVQAFKLRTPYDTKYFGQNYINNQLDGIKNGSNSGFCFWDMINDYKYIQFLAKKK